ncbi:MAG TPA: hypothetical protein VII49_03320 [Rhizomicrobium sp.]
MHRLVPAANDNRFGVVNPTFTYDADGNLLCEQANRATGACTGADARDLAWTSFNMASQIAQSGHSAYTLSYGPEHQRLQQCAPGCPSLSGPPTITRYLDDPAGGTTSEQVTVGSTVTWRTG